MKNVIYRVKVAQVRVMQKIIIVYIAQTDINQILKLLEIVSKCVNIIGILTPLRINSLALKVRVVLGKCNI